MNRLSRTCYDKAHRCPGWAGGGMRSARTVRCDDGRVEVAPRGAEQDDELFNTHPGDHPARFGRCSTCGVITLPVFTKNLDPTWLRFYLPRLVRDAVMEMRRKLERRFGR